MVAILKTGNSIRSILNYNENKVKCGAAECIGAGNYPVDAGKMNVNMKLNRFLKVLELNENVKRNSVHISLNFDPSEKHSKEKLMAIADCYMDKIGFGKQPYLVYEHYDAGHPHIHLVTINIERDGKRIDLHHLAIRKSEPARKAIEKSFGLIEAQGRNNKPQYVLEPINAARVQYGKMQSKKAISNVLDKVLLSYKYSNLAGLNAVLGLYNVYADRGSENSRVFLAGGLVYRILDKEGKPMGVPIKASDFYNKPTLKFLEGKFTLNKDFQLLDKYRVKNAIDLLFLKKEIPLKGFINGLEKKGIHTVLRKSAEDQLYGITYVDHKTKCVFNGSALGKSYSAKAITERCAPGYGSELKTTVLKKETAVGFKTTGALEHASSGVLKESRNETDFVQAGSLLERGWALLSQAENSLEYVPKEFKGKAKKRKRKGQSDNH